MKYLKLPIFLLCLLLLTSCGHAYPYSEILRDAEMTGGSLDFVYDSSSHTATFGGEGQIVQFYKKDITKGWEEDGCRVGIEIKAPSEVKDFESSALWIDGKKMIADEIYQIVNNEKTGRVVLTPIVSQEKKEIEIKIEWKEAAPKQTYKIKIKEGTIFMEE